MRNGAATYAIRKFDSAVSQTQMCEERARERERASKRERERDEEKERASESDEEKEQVSERASEMKRKRKGESERESERERASKRELGEGKAPCSPSLLVLDFVRSLMQPWS